MMAVALTVLAAVGVSYAASPVEGERLEGFELEEAPWTFRLSLIRGRELLIGGIDPDGAVVSRSISPELEERYLHHLEVLITVRHILSLPEYGTEHVFQEDARKTASLHIRLWYNTGRAWHAWYPIGELPPEIADLLEDCRELARELVQTLSEDAEPAYGSP